MKKEKIKIWFSYEFNGVKNHAINKEFCNILIYSYEVKDNILHEFLHTDLEWKLILSESQFWLWNEEELVKLNIDEIRHFIGSHYYHKNKEFRYKLFSSIIKKYLISPLSLEEVIEVLKIKNLKHKEDIVKKLSKEDKFYIATWVQNTI